MTAKGFGKNVDPHIFPPVASRYISETVVDNASINIAHCARLSALSLLEIVAIKTHNMRVDAHSI